jgi:hypothetical protein
MSKTAYTMVIPGLIESRERALVSAVPELNKWLTGSKQEQVASSYYNVLLDLFGYPKGAYNLAKLRAGFDGLSTSDCWICADPIHLGVDVAHIYSLGNAYLNLSTDAIQAYIDSINQYLPLGFELHAPHPLRWYIKLNRAWDLQCDFPDEILARTIIDKLPQGIDAAPAKQLFNEIQMLLYEHPLNLQRREQAQPTVDALWFWGVGSDLPLLNELEWDCVQTDDALALALAKKNKLKTAALSEPVDGNVLMIDTQFQYKDANEQRYQHISKKLNKLYVGNGLAYTKKSTWARVWSR